MDSNWGEALLCGAVGAVALTTVHQLARRATDEAPEMEVVGMRALVRGFRGMGAEPPQGQQLYGMTLAGDLICNSLYYALVSLGRRPNVWVRGAALGLAAGFGALLLPRRMGLGDPPKSQDVANQIMTVAWYLVGGLSAAATAVCLRETREQAHEAYAMPIA
jgi:hypothetical protein